MFDKPVDDPRMTYDNTWYEVDYYGDGMITRNGKLSTINEAYLVEDGGHYYISMRYALWLGIISEFQYELLS
jgi:hypothetical protein